MSTPSQRQDDTEFRDGKIVHDGVTWSAFGGADFVNFTASSLALNWSLDEFSLTGLPSRSLRGLGLVECEGLHVIGAHRQGGRVVRLQIQPADEAFLSAKVEGVPTRGSGKFLSHATLGHLQAFPEHDIDECFWLTLLLSHQTFDALVAEVRAGHVETLEGAMNLSGLYTDSPNDSAKNSKLALAPEHLGSRPAKGRVTSLICRASSTQFARLERRYGSSLEPVETLVPPPEATSCPAPLNPPPLQISLAATEALLSQLVASIRWSAWLLLALVLVATLRLW